MRLYELAYACRVYSHFTGYDDQLLTFRKAVAPELDPFRSDHRAALFRWLNEWGCRQFALSHHASTAADSLVRWTTTWLPRLPGPASRLEELTEAELRLCSEAYAALSAEPASLRGHSSWVVRFGPTGAAKTLFALRPNLIAPWDDPIRVRLRFGGDAAGFRTYLQDVVAQLRELAKEAAAPIASLPALVNRPHSTPPKLIDEYNWVVITKDCRPPSRDEVAQWLRWADGGTSKP
jgi:hypothetical protein